MIATAGIVACSTPVVPAEAAMLAAATAAVVAVAASADLVAAEDAVIPESPTPTAWPSDCNVTTTGWSGGCAAVCEAAVAGKDPSDEYPNDWVAGTVDLKAK